jgi:hypothetical protein
MRPLSCRQWSCGATALGAQQLKFTLYVKLLLDWWGRQDSNLRSHEAADLQSAPFATRDTPPLDGSPIRPLDEPATDLPWA